MNKPEPDDATPSPSSLNREVALTASIVKNAAFPAMGDYTLRDTTQPGLALRVSPGSKTWIVRRKLQGKSFRHTLGRYPEMTIEQARREAQKAMGVFSEGRHPTLERQARKTATNQEWLATKFTVGDMWAEYRNQKRDAEPFSANTLKDFARLENRLKADPIWTASFFALTKEQVREAFARASTSTNSRASNGGKTSANLIFRMLRTAAQFAIANGRAPNPVNLISAALDKNWHPSNARKRTLVADKTSLRRWWEAIDEARAVGRANKGKRASAVIADFQVLVLLWGGRKTETITLQWGDVDFEQKTVRFRAEVTKNGKEHNFPMTPHAELVLGRLRALQAEWGWDSPYVFPATRTGWVTKTKTHIKEPTSAMEKIAAAAGVPFSAHDIRRTFTNLLSSAAEVGAEQTFVKMAMNHSLTDNVTAHHYMDKVEQLRPLYEKLERIVLEKVGVAKPAKVLIDAEELGRLRALEASLTLK